MSKTISACLVVYNEEKHIERCLNSISKIASEIIIIHDGPCSDNTINIANKFNAIIHIRDHFGVADPHRAFAYSLAKGDWILHLDADEYLSEDLSNKITTLITDPNIDNYYFVWPYTDSKVFLNNLEFPKKSFLARKEVMYFIGYPEQQIKIRTGKVHYSNLIVIHHPLYNNFTSKYFFKKGSRWAKYLAKQLVLLPISQVTRFNATDEDVQIVRNEYLNNSFLMMFYYPVKVFLNFLLYRKLYKYKILGLKIAFFSAAFQFVLYGNITKFKLFKILK